jgi:hypothetical protein
MGKRSFAAGLPKDLRAELDRQIAEGGLGVDDVWDWLKDRGVVVGRSSVHRHMQTVEETAALMRGAREAAAALVSKLGPDAAEGQVGALLIEVTQNIAFKLARDQLTKPEGPSLGMEELMFLASTVQKLTGAQKTDTDRILRVRQEVAKSAAQAAERVAKAAGGISKETIAKITEAVLGVAA